MSLSNKQDIKEISFFVFLSPGGSVPHREASSRKQSLLAGTPPFSPGPDGPGKRCQHPVGVTHVKYSNINS